MCGCGGGALCGRGGCTLCGACALCGTEGRVGWGWGRWVVSFGARLFWGGRVCVVVGSGSGSGWWATRRGGGCRCGCGACTLCGAKRRVGWGWGGGVLAFCEWVFGRGCVRVVGGGAALGVVVAVPPVFVFPLHVMLVKAVRVGSGVADFAR